MKDVSLNEIRMVLMTAFGYFYREHFKLLPLLRALCSEFQEAGADRLFEAAALIANKISTATLDPSCRLDLDVLIRIAYETSTTEEFLSLVENSLYLYFISKESANTIRYSSNVTDEQFAEHAKNLFFSYHAAEILSFTTLKKQYREVLIKKLKTSSQAKLVLTSKSSLTIDERRILEKLAYQNNPSKEN